MLVNENFEYSYILSPTNWLILEFTIEEVLCSMRFSENKLDYFIRKNNKDIKSSYLFADDNLDDFDLSFVTSLIDKSFKMKFFV